MENEAHIRHIMRTALIMAQYSLVETNLILDNLISALNGEGGLMKGKEQCKRLLASPREHYRLFIDRALAWDNTTQGHAYWSKVHSRLRNNISD